MKKLKLGLTILLSATFCTVLSCCNVTSSSTVESSNIVESIVESKPEESLPEFKSSNEETSSSKEESSIEEFVSSEESSIVEESSSEISSSKEESQFILKEIILNNQTSTPRLATFESKKTGNLISKTLEPEDINGMPILEVNGSLEGISKEDKKEVYINYISEDKNFTSKATLKIQGASSVGYPKKNYSCTFLTEEDEKNKIVLKTEWGAQSKYCLKANWIDFSHARNVVSGQIFSEIVHSRKIDDMFGKLNNGGVVDGFPVLMYQNGQYHGIYTLNIPKDKWMLGVKDKGHQAIMNTDAWSERAEFKKLLKVADGSGWDPEFVSTEDEENGYDWVIESLNKMIAFTMSTSDEDFKKDIETYVTLDRVIDYIIYICFIGADDNLSKNINWVTYDGDLWNPSPYDLDGTWGLIWHGQSYYAASDLTPSIQMAKDGMNLMFKRIYELYFSQIRFRYLELRGKVLTYDHINEMFTNFIETIPDPLRDADKKLWPDIPSTNTNNLSQIRSWASERIVVYDSFFFD